MPNDRGKPTGDELVQQLFRQYAATRDERLREQLIRTHAPLVQKVARGFIASGEPLEDLVQEGFMGLIKAVDSFETDRDVKFTTYATHSISGEIRHYLRDRKSLIREPGWLHELSQRVVRAVDRLAQTMERPPTVEDVARETDLSEEEVLEIMRTRPLFRVMSLDDDGDDSDTDGGVALDRRKLIAEVTPTDRFAAEDRIVLDEAIRKLKGLERRVIQYLFYGELSQTEIAQRLGISCNYVSHLVRSALRRLRQLLITEELRETHLQHKAAANRQAVAEARQMATTFDDLTHLLTGRSFRERLEQEILRGSRYTHEVCVVLVDLDGFAGLNERYGYQRSDKALLLVGKLLRRNVRKVDVVARYASDTFAILLPRSGAQAGTIVGRRIQDQMVGIDLQQVGIDGPALTAGVGIATFPTDGTTREEVISAAFTALTAAKQAGPGSLRQHDGL